MRLRGTVFVNFENRSEITRRNRFPCVVRAKGPSMSIATNSSGRVEGKSLGNDECLRKLMRSLAHDGQARTHAYTSKDIDGQ